jgi:hypothetical protein
VNKTILERMLTWCLVIGSMCPGTKAFLDSRPSW